MSEFDYVIVGAGSAGCVLANRLSEDPGTTVALIEAGGKDRGLKVRAPAAFPNQFKTKLDWEYYSDPEPHCDRRELFIPRAKMLGGCHSMNAMVYVRGCARDYDDWAVPGWSWADVLPYFMRSEDNQSGAGDVHATGGPLRVTDPRSPRKATGRFLAAAEAAGYPRDADYNDGYPEGCSLAQVTQRDGRRWSVADAFLRPAMARENLTVITKQQVTGIVTEFGKATGVHIHSHRHHDETIVARKEVIVSAGTIGSPQLLMLSGIGPADDLHAADVEVKLDMPQVGENLQDHPFLTLCFEATGDSLYGADSLRYLGEWLARKSGPLTSTIAEAFLYTASRDGLPAPDLQFHFAPGYFNDNGEDEFEAHAFSIGPVLVAPRARGSVRLRSADPHDKPSILTNSLDNAEDVAALLEGIRIARRIAQQQPLEEIAVREILPGPDAESDEAIVADLRRRVQLLYHPVGTCRMGTDSNSVVDEELRVRGVENLRVADASVMPTITRGNTNAPTIMIAERAADLIRGRVSAAADRAVREPVAP